MSPYIGIFTPARLRVSLNKLIFQGTNFQPPNYNVNGSYDAVYTRAEGESLVRKKLIGRYLDMLPSKTFKS